MSKQNNTNALVKKNEIIRLILLIPLILAIIWLIILAPQTGTDEMPSPYIQMSMIKGIILFAIVYSTAAIIFYRHINKTLSIHIS